MINFVQRHAENVIGVLSGFDRVRIRGTMRSLAHVGGVMHLLWQLRVLLKNFGSYMDQQTDLFRQATVAMVERAGQKVRYQSRPSDSKEELVRSIIRQERVREGPVCVLSALEPGLFYEVVGNRGKRQLELRRKMRPGLHYYHYWIHPVLGLINARIATWFPYDIHICFNGRQWLARQMDQAGIGYRQHDNCFTWIEDVAAAQKLMDGQLRMNWPALLQPITAAAGPVHGKLLGGLLPEYYYSVDQSEWATDVMFKDTAALARLYPRLVQHGMLSLGCTDIMRFMGRAVRADGAIGTTFGGEVISDMAMRARGVRLKHRVAENFIKMYDKAGSILRVEMTINRPGAWKVYRTKEGDENGPRSWRQLRKGVADIQRRAEVAQAANERYLEAAAAVSTPTALGELSGPLCRPVTWKDKRVRALNPLSSEDHRLLAAVARGEFVLHGFRNRDLRQLLEGDAPADKKALRRQSAAITRKLRMLRAHGLIKKVPRTHRYLLSDKGRQAITAVLAASKADAAKLQAAA